MQNKNHNIYCIHGEVLNQEIELEILKNISNAKNQKSIADEIGYSVGKVNYVLKALIEKGLIKSERFLNSNNKVQYKYLLTEEGIKEKIDITDKFIKRKKAEYEQLQLEMDQYKQQYLSLNDDTPVPKGKVECEYAKSK